MVYKRNLIAIHKAHPTHDGDGVKINRIAGNHLFGILDPFLLLDEIRSDEAADYIGGFPEHPHRGFETITFMKTGRMRHRDHMGNEGVIGPGDVQWMTAGRGVLHSEMPEQQSGLLHGFQLWLNLPAAEKMKPAAYQDIRTEQIPVARMTEGQQVRVIAGEVSLAGQTLSGPVDIESTEPLLLDVLLPAAKSVELVFAPHNPAWVYVFSGATDQLQQQQMGCYSEGVSLRLQAGESDTGLLVLSGKPLREPVVQYGPFVMNSREEIDQAIGDYQRNQLV